MELKRRLQKEWADKYAGMSIQEQISLRAKRLQESDDALARWWRGEKIEVPREHTIEHLLREAREREAAKPPKEFDCVAMKRELQAEFTERTAGMTGEELVDYLRQRTTDRGTVVREAAEDYEQSADETAD
jgi:hypothetical protein